MISYTKWLLIEGDDETSALFALFLRMMLVWKGAMVSYSSGASIHLASPKSRIVKIEARRRLLLSHLFSKALYHKLAQNGEAYLFLASD